MTDIPNFPAPKKDNVTKRAAIFLQVIVVVVIVFIGASLYRTILDQASQLEVTKNNVNEQKDQVSSLSAQISSLNDKIKEYKKQSDDLDASVAQEKETVDAMKKNYDALEVKINDLNQEFDDKFGRLSKEITDVKELVGPVKDDIALMKEDTQKWQKDYVAALSDLQVHVTRAAGLIAQMRDEVNKKIDFISMVQEKMIKDAAVANSIPMVSKPTEDPDRTVHHQIMNSDLSEFKDKADYKAETTTK